MAVAVAVAVTVAAAVDADIGNEGDDCEDREAAEAADDDGLEVEVVGTKVMAGEALFVEKAGEVAIHCHGAAGGRGAAAAAGARAGAGAGARGNGCGCGSEAS